MDQVIESRFRGAPETIGRGGNTVNSGWQGKPVAVAGWLYFSHRCDRRYSVFLEPFCHALERSASSNFQQAKGQLGKGRLSSFAFTPRIHQHKPADIHDFHLPMFSQCVRLQERCKSDEGYPNHKKESDSGRLLVTTELHGTLCPEMRAPY